MGTKEMQTTAFSIEQLAGQRLMAGFDGTTLNADLKFLINHLKIGGIILFSRNLETPDQIKHLCDEVQNYARLCEQPPLFIAVDQEGGQVARLKEPFTQFPGNPHMNGEKDAINFAKVTAAELTRVHQSLQQQVSVIDERERFDLLRGLPFFHDFSHSEIWEVLRASDWSEYRPGQEIVKEGELDDRFYVIVGGRVCVEVGGREVGRLAPGECFGETSYVRGAKRQASIQADGQVTILRVSSTLMEQVSSACQLRFNKVFLRQLITRLQSRGTAKTST